METVHFDDLMGVKGMCESVTARTATIAQLEKALPKLYKDPKHGPCADEAKAKCKS